MRILITGATGFVGSHILESLMEDNDLTLRVACRSTKKLNPDFSGEILLGDLRDDEYTKEIVKDVNVICHAAAWTSLWGHKAHSNSYFLEPSIQLIHAAKKASVEHFIFPSTTSAAAPSQSHNALSKGIPRAFWPHLSNVIKIENVLRDLSDEHFATTVLRLGIFTGERYALGLLPILLPRLKTHLVPWVSGGNTTLPLIDGRDIGQAFSKAVRQKFEGYHAYNIVGLEQPSVRELVSFIHEKTGLPKPHFSVPFALAYPFAGLMEKIDRFVPWEPLVTRSIIHLLEETNVNNDQANQALGYQATIHWKDSVSAQIEAIKRSTEPAMSMVVKV